MPKSYARWKEEEEKKEAEWFQVHVEGRFFKSWAQSVPELPLPSYYSVPDDDVLSYASQWRESIRDIYLSIHPWHRPHLQPPEFPYNGSDFEPFIQKANILKTMMPRQVILQLLTLLLIGWAGYVALGQFKYYDSYSWLRRDFQAVGELPIELRFPYERINRTTLKEELELQQSAYESWNVLGDVIKQPWSGYTQLTEANVEALKVLREWHQAPKTTHTIASHTVTVDSDFISTAHYGIFMNHSTGQYGQKAVNMVSYSDALIFIEQFNQALGLSNCDEESQESSGCEGWRLPLKEEWSGLSKSIADQNKGAVSWGWILQRSPSESAQICPVAADAQECLWLPRDTRSHKVGLILVKGPEAK